MSQNYEFQKDTAGLAEVPGFKVAGVGCDIRGKGNDRLDVALIYSERPCTAAGTFTTNDVKAACVRLCLDHMAQGGPFHAIVANSGNANACTGEPGRQDANAMAEQVAAGLGVHPRSVFVCSTGRIGERLPMDRVSKGVKAALESLAEGADAGNRAAQAILTSDTRPKTATATFEWRGEKIVVSGMAKGAGMIQPNMATMLAFIGTNLEMTHEEAQAILRESVFGSFNKISIDGDTSTNDTVILLANGASGMSLRDFDGQLSDLFRKALKEVCDTLAFKIVSDGERISKVIRLQIKGAHNDADAEKAARAIGNSLLVKTSWFGGDPNWGRVLHAAGYARIGLDESILDLYYGDVPVIVGGKVFPENKPRWKQEVAQKYFTIILDLKLGKGACEILATDLTEGYVNFNKSE